MWFIDKHCLMGEACDATGLYDTATDCNGFSHGSWQNSSKDSVIAMISIPHKHAANEPSPHNAFGAQSEQQAMERG